MGTRYIYIYTRKYIYLAPRACDAFKTNFDDFYAGNAVLSLSSGRIMSCVGFHTLGLQVAQITRSHFCIHIPGPLPDRVVSMTLASSIPLVGPCLLSWQLRSCVLSSAQQKRKSTRPSNLESWSRGGYDVVTITFSTSTRAKWPK